MSDPKLNQLPAGLLDAFGIKNGGRYPELLLPTLSPVLELSDWYWNARAQTYLVQNNAVATGGSVGNGFLNVVNLNVGGGLPHDGATIAVPMTETWMLLDYECGVTFNVIAGETGGVTPAYAVPVQGGNYTPIALPSVYYGLSASSVGFTAGQWAAASNMPRMLPPGARINPQANVRILTATTVAVTCVLRLVRFVL